MKKIFIAGLVIGLLVAFALPAPAQLEQEDDICDVSFNVDVEKDKTITIDKTVEKNFEYNLNVEFLQAFSPLQLSEVEVFKCDLNAGNVVEVEELGGSTDITGSFTNFAGIVQVNQSSGLLNNQGNIAAAGFTDQTGDQTVWGVSMVEVAVEKTNAGNMLTVTEIHGSDNISTAGNGFAGLSQINQSSGVLNNQNNVVAIAKNFNTIGIMAENDTFLSMENSGNEPTVDSITASAKITDSFQNGSGAVQINQGAGALNNQTNIISIAFAGQ